MYSEKVMDHLNIKKCRRIENASGVGTVGNDKMWR